jgi:PAS domain S-box-containing protein
VGLGRRENYPLSSGFASIGPFRPVSLQGTCTLGLAWAEFNALSGEPANADRLLAETFARVLAGETVRYEVQRRRKDGAVIDLQGTFVPRRVDGEIVGLTSTTVDITERKRADRELMRLAEAVEYGTDAVVSMDFDGIVCHWNRGAEPLLGLGAQEAIGHSVVEVNALTGQPDDANERARDLIDRIRRGEPAYHMAARRRRKDGGVSDVLVTVTPWHVDVRLAGVTTTSLDITERARAEQATAQLAAIVDASDDAIVGKTLDGQITSWNPAAEQIYGYSAADAIGHPVSMLAPGREDELAMLLARVAGGERVSHLETILRRKDGREIDVSVTISPIRDLQGQIVGAATITRDITERKTAERELERLAQAAEHGSD